VSQSATLIYDGDCGFCTSSASWIRARWRRPCAAVAWQELGGQGLADVGLTVDDVTSAAWFVHGRTKLRGARAVAAALKLAGPGWRAVGAIIDIPPLRWLAAIGYAVVARYRYLLPGSTDACHLD